MHLGRTEHITSEPQYITEFLKDILMKARNIENNLALVGALIVLVGVSFAAEDALGFEYRRRNDHGHRDSRRSTQHDKRRGESQCGRGSAGCKITGTRELDRP